MKLNLLLTAEIKATMFESINVVQNYGEILVVFPDGDHKIGHTMWGDNAILEVTEEDFKAWLKPFDGVAVGVGGSPQMEEFTIMHIKD